MLTHWNRLTASTLANAGRLKHTHIDLIGDDSRHLSLITDIGADCSGIIATGVDASSRIAFGCSDGLALSVNHGRLADDYNLIGYDDTLRVASRHFPPAIVVSDSHPGLASTRVGRALANRAGARLIAVDHGHAHMAAVMAENRLHGSVVGILLDSNDISDADDGRRLRGAELLVCSRRECRSLNHPDSFTMPRDAAPWEAAVGLIIHHTGSATDVPRWLADAVGRPNIILAAERCRNKVDSVTVAGGAAYWDAIAAIIATARGGVCGAFADHRMLDSLASGLIAAPYDIDYERPVSTSGVAEDVMADLNNNTDARVVAARFVATEARAWAVAAARASAELGVKEVAAGGELLRSPLLQTMLRRNLSRLGLGLYLPSLDAAGDAGITIGQAAVAAALRA